MREPAVFLANWHKRATDKRTQFIKAVRQRKLKDKVSNGLDALEELDAIREELDNWLRQQRPRSPTLTEAARELVQHLLAVLENLATATFACIVEFGQLEERPGKPLTPKQTSDVTTAMVNFVRPVEKCSQELLDSVAEMIEAQREVGLAMQTPRRTEVRADSYDPRKRHA
ncbi:hypothetical protein [Lentzea sp. NPDC059081]|uniref:hypothetical protein n=1 Tax=Lentzea sp. NPDC059081 TaxID=3346719 RepID=UPI0036B2E2F8